MNYDRPHEYSDVPSKDRLHKEKLSLLVEGEVPENYDPDQISWVTEDLGISDWEGAVNALKLGYFVITVAAELNIGAQQKLAIIPGSGDVRVVLDKIVDNIEKALVKKLKVVIHCAMGMERAPLAVYWYLSRVKKISLEDAFIEVKKIRPIACNRIYWIQS